MSFLRFRRSIYEIMWTEPYEITRQTARLEWKQKDWSTKWLRPSLLALVIAGGVMLMWFLFSLVPDNNPSPFALMLALALTCGFTLAYCPSLATQFGYRRVGLGRTAVIRQAWTRFECHPFEHIACVHFDTVSLARGRPFHLESRGEREIRTMVVTMRDSKQLIFGVSDKVNLSEVTDFLRSKGVEVEGTD
jgi:hypothetical protein